LPGDKEVTNIPLTTNRSSNGNLQGICHTNFLLFLCAFDASMTNVVGPCASSRACRDALRRAAAAGGFRSRFERRGGFGRHRREARMTAASRIASMPADLYGAA
jgi:hypothetical protein